MKLLFIKLIALMIAVASLQVAVDSNISFNEEGSNSLFSLPAFDLDPIRNPTNKSSVEADLIQPDLFSPLPFLPEVSLEIIPYLFYLPIYSLNRAKVYFLLI